MHYEELISPIIQKLKSKRTHLIVHNCVLMFLPRFMEGGQNFTEFFFFFVFLGHLWHMEGPRLGVKLELQPLAYTAAMQDPSCIFDLHHSSRQCQILNPPSMARDWTCVLMDTSQIHIRCTIPLHLMSAEVAASPHPKVIIPLFTEPYNISDSILDV